MNIEIMPNGILKIDEARIIHRNFAGVADKYNREGERNFSVVIPNQDICDLLVEEGWNVKIKPPIDEDDEAFMYLPVKVKFNARGPKAFLLSGEKATELDAESIACIDDVDILSVDLDIRPYDWNTNGKSGRTAYLQGIWVVQKIDRFEARFEARQ